MFATRVINSFFFFFFVFEKRCDTFINFKILKWTTEIFYSRGDEHVNGTFPQWSQFIFVWQKNINIKDANKCQLSHKSEPNLIYQIHFKRGKIVSKRQWTFKSLLLLILFRPFEELKLKFDCSLISHSYDPACYYTINYYGITEIKCVCLSLTKSELELFCSHYKEHCNYLYLAITSYKCIINKCLQRIACTLLVKKQLTDRYTRGLTFFFFEII